MFVFIHLLILTTNVALRFRTYENIPPKLIERKKFEKVRLVRNLYTDLQQLVKREEDIFYLPEDNTRTWFLFCKPKNGVVGYGIIILEPTTNKIAVRVISSKGDIYNPEAAFQKDLYEEAITLNYGGGYEEKLEILGVERGQGYDGIACLNDNAYYANEFFTQVAHQI